MKKFLFVLVVLAAAITAGCITSPQIPPGCSGLQTDEECAASLATTPAPTGSNLVVKSEQVQVTPMPTESMPVKSVPTKACSIKTTWKKEQLGSARVDPKSSSEENYNNATTMLCSDGVLVTKAVIATTGEIEVLIKNTGDEIITINMELSALNLTPEEKRLYPGGIEFGANFNLMPEKVVGIVALPTTTKEFEIIAEYKFQTS